VLELETLSRAEKLSMIDAIRAKAKRDLLAFILWTKSDYNAGWFHYELAAKLDQFLQDVIDRKSPRLMIMAPPRSGKSEMVSRRFPAYALGRYPDLTFIATSYSNDLASMMNRDVQKIIDQEEYAQLFPDTTLSSSSVRTVTSKGSFLRNSEQFEIVGHKGAYKSAGVGTGVTGRGARVLMIDDPVKDAQEAYSVTTRQSIWDWYETTLKTRAEPGGGILLIMCVTGDTPVLMADGTEKPMLDVRAGDEIATFNKGALSTSFVKHWKSQGSDFCYEIRTSSGRLVKANERHPFLVRRSEALVWTRLRNLKVGDKLVSVTATGAELSALSMGVRSQSVAKDSANLTTTKPAGRMVCDRLQSILNRAGRRVSNIATALLRKSSTRFLNSREESAPFAGSHLPVKTQGLIGTPSYALTTTTEPVRREDSCATTATSQLATERLHEFSALPPNIYDFTEDEICAIEPVGEQEVFDIEVEGTENFIANGLVAHNTRWHADDLAGRLLTAMGKGGEKWEVAKYPAIAEEDEKYRRKGEALHPARYPIEALNRIRYGSGDIDEVGTGSRVWASLYQQRPSAAEGVIFLRDNWKYVSGPPADVRIGGDEVERLKVFFQLEQIIQYWDTAAGGKQSNDNAACVTMGIAKDGYVMLDLFCEKIEFPELERKVEQLYDKWRPSQVGIEGGGSATGKAVIQALSRLTRIPFVEVVHSTDKVLRANVVSPIQEAGLVRILKGTKWAHDFVESCAIFPNAAKDDDVDAFMGALELVTMRRAPLKISKSLLASVGG
jgi:predicted phage terminase large subunit-like protein